MDSKRLREREGRDPIPGCYIIWGRIICLWSQGGMCLERPCDSHFLFTSTWTRPWSTKFFLFPSIQWPPSSSVRCLRHCLHRGGSGTRGLAPLLECAERTPPATPFPWRSRCQDPSQPEIELHRASFYIIMDSWDEQLGICLCLVIFLFGFSVFVCFFLWSCKKCWDFIQ